jgi:hypothetical protein
VTHTPGALGWKWERVAARAKLKEVTLHGLRHWFASSATELGYSDLIIGALGPRQEGYHRAVRYGALPGSGRSSRPDQPGARFGAGWQECR